MYLKTSIEVAEELGIPRPTLIVYVFRHPELKPAKQIPSGDYLWTDAEIAALKKRRANPSKGGRPGKTEKAWSSL